MPYDYSYVTPDPKLIPYGTEMLSRIMEKYRNGLPKNIEDNIRRKAQGQIRSNVAEGEQNLKEQLQSANFGTPIDAIVSGQSRIRTGANNALADLNDTVEMQDYNASNDAFGEYANLFNLIGKESDSLNRYRSDIRQSEEQKRQYDDSQKFKPGQAVGSALQAAAQVGSAAIMTCFCYAETYGINSKEFIFAREWGINNATPAIRLGYIKLSALLIPIMRKYSWFKKLFRVLIAENCLKQMHEYHNQKPMLLLPAFLFVCKFLGKYSKLTKKDKLILKTVF